MASTMNDRMIRAVKKDDLATLEDLIVAGADVACEDNQGWTPLFHAASRGNRETIRVLISAGANPNQKKEEHFSPLLAAVLAGHVDAVRLLLEAGAVPDITPSGSPLTAYLPHLSCSDRRKRQILELLTNHPNKGAEPGDAGNGVKPRREDRYTSPH